MKKHFIMAFAAISVLASCSDNDTQNMDVNPGESSMALNKTITYYPALENFETRNVKYYENNHIVADSTYDANGNFISLNTHTYNSDNYIIDKKDPAGVIIATAVEQYDAQGRLEEFFNFGDHYHYSYNENGISVEYFDPSGAIIEVGAFMYNADGSITSHSVLANDIITEATSLSFSDNAKPVALMAQGITGAMEQLGTFTYYPNSMPSNLQKTIVQINNEVLKSLKLEAAALLGNYHLQDFTVGGSSRYHSETVFNPVSGLEGYPQYQTITVEGQPFCYIQYSFLN